MRQTLLLSAAVVGMAVGSAWAQTTGTGTTGTGTAPTTSSPTMTQSSPGATGGSQNLAALPNAIVGSRLMDVSVKNQSDETVGEIDDLLIDSNGKIQQVVISTGGVLGVGGKKVLLPWDQVRYDASRQVAMVSMSQDALKNLPEYQAPARDRSTTRDRDTGPARAPGAAGGGMGTGGTGTGGTGTGGTGTTRP